MTAQVPDLPPVEPGLRVHERIPISGRPVLERVEWAIECCLQAAYETGEDDMVLILSSLCPGMDKTVVDSVGRLLELGEEHVDASRAGDWPRARCAEQEYRDELYTLARDLTRARVRAGLVEAVAR